MKNVNVSFNLEIDSGNDALIEEPQVQIGRILEDIKRTIGDGYDSGMVRDSNGNRVGTWKLDVETE